MGHAKLSVTIPDKMYKEIKELASRKNIKISHLVTEALAEKAEKMREEALIKQINDAFKDPDVADEQSRMAELIADNTEVDELPW